MATFHGRCRLRLIEIKMLNRRRQERTVSGDREKDAAEARSSLERGIERSRRAVARYRARLLVLREAVERQRFPQFTGRRPPVEQR